MDPAQNPEQSPVNARDFYDRGLDLKKQGQSDAALAEFRRAALADPNFREALFEIGRLSLKKADQEPNYKRLAFDSLQKAARMDLTDEAAHDAYIMISQKMGRLDEIHSEYDSLAKQHPDNELLKRCLKNIVTISMAMMPEQVSMAGGDNKTLRKFLLFAALGTMVFGGVCFVAPFIFKDLATQIKSLVRIGMVLEVLGLTAFIIRSRFK